MSFDIMALSPQNMVVGAGGGAFAGYASGRVVKMAVNIVKWIAAIFVGIEVALHEMGLITIHFGEFGEFMTGLFGGQGIEAAVSTMTNLIFSFVPAAGGFGAGFYAGYKKMLV